MSRHHKRLLRIVCTALLTLSTLVSCRQPTTEPMRTAAPQATSTPTPQQAAEPTPVSQAGSFEGAPLSNFATSRFAGAGECAFCHDGLVDSTGHDVSIGSHWRSTIMANGAKDPLWLAKVSSESARNPAIREVIEEKCATCHMPMAYTEAKADGAGLTILGDGFYRADHPLHEAAMDGVSCTLCHQIQDAGLGEPTSFSGGYGIDTSTSRPDRLIYGPYPDPLTPQMQMHVGYTPVEGPHVRESGLCATCHTLYTPYLDAEGNIAGEFPEQVPYLEWQNSDYRQGRSCQSCHMPTANGEVIISTMPRGRRIQPRQPFSQHHFVGGNTFVIGILKAFGPELGLTAGTTHLAETQARTTERLEQQTAQVSIREAQVSDGKLVSTLQISSQVGHKLPTGFPSRRAWLHIAVTGADGQTIFESGQPLDDGSIAGNDADRDASAYEPHYDRISDPEQVQIYESVMQNTEGQVTYTLLRGASYIKDNRILPSGFDQAAAGPDTAVHGAAAEDETFAGGSDHLSLEVDLGERNGPYTLSVRLLYQSVSYRFNADLCQDSGDLVERWCGYYDAAAGAYVVLAEAREQIP